MARAKYTNVDKAMAWAKSVLKGKFPACRFKVSITAKDPAEPAPDPEAPAA